MSRPRFLTMIAGAALFAAPALPAECDPLSELELPDVEMSAVTEIEQPVAHCKLDGRIGHHIGFTVWLPHDWNGRFAMGGQGGFAGVIDNQAQTFGRVLQQGYATAATDTGHQALALDGRWALEDLEAIANYGHVAVHRVAEVAKAIIGAHYDQALETSYFLGCSNGGRQALMEAQRYPEDFDVILAGAPALDFDGIGATFLQVTRHMYPDMEDLSQPVLGKESRALLQKEILDHCDAKDGLTDELLADPAACDFDPQSLACSKGESEGCLEPDELAAIRAIYEGPRTRSGEPLHVGYPFGAEDVDANGWGSWLTGREDGAGPGVPSAAYAFGTGLARYFVYHDPEWSYEGYDFSRWPEDSKLIQATLNADDPDLDAFRERGGKLLMFHGWSDSALSANMSIDYVSSVYERDPSARDDVRLFLMPGLLHCFGGNGPMVVDWLGTMERWQETGTPPSELEAGFVGGGGRKLCAWPKKAVYTGGDDRSPESFDCR
ncbi:MAG TPA: tannase/feruloyl esterase family alpha/beta hydrolase [Thermoanaerobaculia bacterium]|nr:tannase/feruloyl esterase family alpha/beta hydrolase [Thermoanaerobaculia bacterium]